MHTVGIVCEYNPLHLGHQKQILRIREIFGQDTGVVCAMSGNFVQRGAPAIIDQSLRAKAAVYCGADLVLALPVTTSLSSAEGFASGGVSVLAKMCDTLCFGAENPDKTALLQTAQVLLRDDFPPLLRQELEKGCSFPAARQAALAAMGADTTVLTQPNNILAVEYCKAILSQKVSLEPLPILRKGSYHAEIIDEENPSATAVRSLMLNAYNWRLSVPKAALPIFENAPLHSTAAGERAVLARLRTMADEDFEALPYGSEGLWRKLMHACRREASLEQILTAVKTKRYTRSRLDRMVMCAFLGITREAMNIPPSYIRVLAFNDRGRAILKQAKQQAVYLNPGESLDHPCWELEKRCGDLYGLFAIGQPEPPDAEARRRIFYQGKL